MHADQLCAGRACPARVLISDELSYSQVFNLQQIIQHAHAIFSSISLINVFQSGAGKDSAGVITVFAVAFAAETQRALLAASGIRGQAAFASVSVANIPDAKPAVHSAWSYVGYLGLCRHHNSFCSRLIILALTRPGACSDKLAFLAIQCFPQHIDRNFLPDFKSRIC